MGDMSLLIRRSLGVLITLLCLAGCATVTNPVSGRQELSVMDERTEIAEGRKAHEQVLKEYGVYRNPKLQAYVDELGQRLAKQSHRKELTWHFTVLDSPEINAFALPGGYIYVTRGIMAYLDSEADLAGVIGHEIGHVTARHGAQRATRQQTAGLGVMAANILGAVLESRGYAGAGNLINQGSQGIAAGFIAAYGRDQELEADQLGAEYLVRNQYHPQNMVDVINVLKNQERFAEDKARAEGKTVSGRGGWLASHPSNDQRLQDITRIAGQYPKADYKDDGRNRYFQAIDGMVFGDAADQGLIRGTTFYHPKLGFAMSAPSGWKIRNGNEALTFTNASEDAGLIVKTLPPSAGGTHEEILRKTFALQQLRSERFTVDTFPATHFSGVRRTQQGQTQSVEATLLTGPQGQNYVLIYAARDAQSLQRARRDIQAVGDSFRNLRDSERSTVKPWSIRLKPFPRGGFAELARQSSLSEQPEKQLRLLNGFYTGGEAKPGQLVKVIE